MCQNENKPIASNRTLTEEQSVDLAKLLIMMKVPKEERLDILTAIETVEELRLFLDILAEKDFVMPPEEVYQAHLDAIVEIQLRNQ
jgi:hypothetical protein